MKKIIVTSILFSLFAVMNGQRWQDVNRGLYPNSVHITMNVRNESIGLLYCHLFQKPVFHVPLGVYGFFMNTIPESWRLPNYAMYNNYAFERKWGVGLTFTLPQSRDQQNLHVMSMLGFVNNIHPLMNQNSVPGQFDPKYYSTSKWGFELGVKFRVERRAEVHIKCDIANFMRYVELGAGYSFAL